MTTRPLVVRPEDLDQPGGGPLVVRPEELDDTPRPQKQGFKRSLRTGMGFSPEGGFMDDVSQIGQGFKQMATHPVDSLSDLISAAYQGQEDVARKGMSRMGKPGIMNKIEGGAQYLESGVPFAGPILSRAGEQAEEEDYGGMAGTMVPLGVGLDTKPFRGAMGDVMRTPGGAVKPVPRLATQIATGAAGHEILPYTGGYLGWKAGGPLADMIVPAKTPKMWPGAKRTPWEAPVEPAATPATSEATQTLRGNKTPFSAPGATSSAPGPGAARGPEGPLAKPRLSAQETSEYFKSKGRSAGRLSEDIDAADAADAGATKENLSPYMKRKIDEAEGRHDAGRMAATGAVTGEDSRAARSRTPESPVYIEGYTARPLGGGRTHGDLDRAFRSQDTAEKAAAKLAKLPGFDNARAFEQPEHPGIWRVEWGVTPEHGGQFRGGKSMQMPEYGWGRMGREVPGAIDEATASPQEATRSRQTGASTAKLREEMRQAEERGNVERRVNPGLRAATGPDPVRQSLVREAQKVIDDPESTARDKSIAKAQIADIEAHPFEGAKGEDYIKQGRAKTEKRMTRKQAEAASEKRSAGHKKRQRLSEEMGND